MITGKTIVEVNQQDHSLIAVKYVNNAAVEQANEYVNNAVVEQANEYVNNAAVEEMPAASAESTTTDAGKNRPAW